MNTTRPRRALVAATILLALASVGGAAASASGCERPDASVASTGATVTSTTGWRVYEGPFKSYATCDARARAIRAIYGGTHHGAVAATQCVMLPLPTCPTRWGIMLEVKYVTGVGGGGGGTWSVDPAATAA